MTVLSLIIVLWLALRGSPYPYHAFNLPFFVTTVVGCGCYRIRVNSARSYNLKSEKLNEDINVLSHNAAAKRGAISALEERLDRYSTLEGVLESFSNLLSVDDIAAQILEKTRAIIGKEGRTLLFVVDTEKQELMLASSESAAAVLTKKGDAFDRWVLRNRKSLMIEDITKDFRFSAADAEAAKATFRSLIEVPLLSEDKVIGILRMDSAHDLTYAQDDLRLLDIIANLGAVVMQNALLYSRAQETATRDGLTGLVVRRYFLERFEEEIKRSAMRKGALSVLMLDIDRFKEYNDKYGHAAGDLILKHLARTIKSIAREGDIVARYGGEELVILLCGIDRRRACAEAEEIRKVVKNEPLMLRRHTNKITVSVGVASYPEDALSEEDLMRIADERLYRAKAGGRDRVCSD